ncbi:ArsB/NhaD family transporter [Anaeromyxobacter oryzae]|uniref:Anion transporter n=1 Tax=Anaeromyxobacter oryzae TaxID=2918170 RepID=A0ABM7X422_9BACT|nr:SLC13 family permease [Anaeromyxobacter oryzae]BDG06547.1 anion transporter [Anaeromyxobacter oryzae]
MTAALVVFALTYVAVAAGRFPLLSVDRPAAALLGAVLMVAARVLTPAQAGAAVNGDTLGLLLGMMILTAYLGEAGFFRWASWRVIRAAGTPRTLLWGLVFTAGGLSALLVNDTVCLMMTPLVLRIIDDAELPPIPYLLAVAFGSNAGSVATLTGNPQNMIIGTLSGISYARFAAALVAPAAASLVLVAAILHAIFRRHLPRRALATALPEPELDRRLLAKALAALGIALGGFLLGFALSWTSLFAGALCMAVAGRAPREALQRVDWPLLVFFAGLFVVVAGVGEAGVAGRMYDAVAPALGRTAERQALVFGAFSVAASQVVSNVPFVILAGHWIPRLADPRLLWLATALSATLAGNLTVVGSVANIIVLELAGSRGRIGFWRFFRIGAAVTAATLVAGLGLLLLERRLGLL